MSDQGKAPHVDDGEAPVDPRGFADALDAAIGETAPDVVAAVRGKVEAPAAAERDIFEVLDDIREQFDADSLPLEALIAQYGAASVAAGYACAAAPHIADQVEKSAGDLYATICRRLAAAPVGERGQDRLGGNWP